MSEKNTKTKYTATLTLTQNGIDGDVFSSLRFDPLIKPEDLDSESMDGIPAAYELISLAAEAMLIRMGILNEEGELLDEEAASATVSVNASSRQLN